MRTRSSDKSLSAILKRRFGLVAESLRKAGNSHFAGEGCSFACAFGFNEAPEFTGSLYSIAPQLLEHKSRLSKGRRLMRFDLQEFSEIRQSTRHHWRQIRPCLPYDVLCRPRP